MFATIQVIGNVGGDPEVRTMNGGGKVAGFSVAHTERWKSAGEDKEKTTWFRVDVFQNGDTGLVTNLIVPHLTKGQLVFIQGSPTIEEYEKDGQTVRAFKIRLSGPGSVLRMLGGKSSGKKDSAAGARWMPSAGEQSERGPKQAVSADDDIPF